MIVDTTPDAIQTNVWNWQIKSAMFVPFNMYLNMKHSEIIEQHEI